jgi:hypothetical protein
MKPDFVTAGHFILMANAKPDTGGKWDSWGEPDVKDSIQNGSGIHYTTGTSMAAPILAGATAIVQQYFEEGFCNVNVGWGIPGINLVNRS